MKVAVVYQYYQGHDAPGHSLMYELTQYLGNQGHEVSVISGETGYMHRAARSPLPWYRRLLRRERIGSVNVIRTFTYSELHRSYLGRLLSFISFSLSSPLGLLNCQRPDVVLASSPPIFPMLPIWLICKLRRIPLVFEVRDLWPASAVQMGILRSRPLIAIMAWMERVLYDNARKIVTLTAGIRDDIRARGWAENKLEFIPCGIDPGFLYPDRYLAQQVRSEEGWGDKRVALYFGAMGEANNLSVVLRAAERLRSQNYLFILIGDGMKRPELQEQIDTKELKNVRLLPPMPKIKARGYINAADVCLVTLLDIPLFEGAIPTKLLDYMACAKPVLCGVGGEAKDILERAQAGLCFSPNDDAELAGLMSQIANDDHRLQSMGRNGRHYVCEHFAAERTHLKMEAVLADAAGL
jgi:glycosyltransferase involved in cell wall biosynthesis